MAEGSRVNAESQDAGRSTRYRPRVSSASTQTEAYLERVRRRALVFIGLRSACVGLAAVALCLSCAAVAVGPLPARTLAIGVLLLSGIAGVTSALFQSRRAGGVRGAAITDWLRPISPQLASRARTVLELAESARGASPALVRAHRAAVEQELGQVPLAVAAPLGRELTPRLVLALAAVALCTTVVLGSTRGRAGAYGLIHAFEPNERGPRRADLVAETAATLRFAAYRGRQPLEMLGADAIEAPHGTSIAYRVRFHSAPSTATLQLPGGEVRLLPLGSGPSEGVWYGAEFVATTAGAMQVVVIPDTGAERAADRRTRSLRVTADQPPVATLAGPADAGDLPLDLPTRIGYAGTDDVGVTEVLLLIARPDGTEEHRRLASHPSTDLRVLVQGSVDLVPADVGAQAGDPITVTLEVHDGDVLSGPHVTRSEPLTLRVASAGARRRELLAGLEALLGTALDTLAERLENPLERPDRSDATDLARHAHLTDLERGLLRALRTYATAQSGTDVTIGAQVQRLERGMQREARAYTGRSARERAARDDEQAAVLEDIVLALDAYETQARLNDAAELAQELLALRRELASLLAELRRADTEEARRAVAAAIGRARDRLAQLAQRIAEIDPATVPPEFANQGAMQREASDALGALEQALRSDDLDAADRHMHDLERQIDQLIASLGNVEEQYGEEHFGAQDRALAEALDALNGLETEQRVLSERTDRTRRAAAARALRAAGEDGSAATRRVRAELATARRTLADVPEGGIGARDRDSLSRTRQRLVDAEDALQAGDLGEARRMVAEARADALGLSRDLELSALMFGGANGRTSDAAEQVGAAARRIAALEGELDRSIPNLREHLEAAEAAQLREDSARQERAQDATTGLAQRFREGPGGEALSEEAASALERVGAQMRDAQRALRRLDAVGAGAQQAEAAEALRELREELEEQSRGGGGGGSGGGRGGAGTAPPGQRVAIPTADDHEGPGQFRRRVLDAMERGAPEGYDEATRSYYERLLR
ncbi:MAG: DUF4175 family protein [Sandaracinaceae bacterium]|nr:DUF4175 family protein [Sandaracinaceae bacterium]